jgi:hypothetical protein
MRLKLKPKDGWSTALLVLFLTALGACLLTACSTPGWVPATRDFAAEVAQDNAEAAKHNPFSAVLHGLATLTAALAGTGYMVRQYDRRPYERADGSKVTEAEIAGLVPPKPPGS